MLTAVHASKLEGRLTIHTLSCHLARIPQDSSGTRFKCRIERRRRPRPSYCDEEMNDMYYIWHCWRIQLNAVKLTRAENITHLYH